MRGASWSAADVLVVTKHGDGVVLGAAGQASLVSSLAFLPSGELIVADEIENSILIVR